MIEHDEQYLAIRAVLKMLYRLNIKSADSLDSKILNMWGDVFEPCGYCEQVPAECKCHEPTHYDRYGRSAAFDANPYDDYDPG